MGLFKKKNQKKYIRGGFKKYRNPSVFKASDKLIKREKKPLNIKPLPIKPALLSLAIILLLWFLFLSNFFRIADVLVDGNKLVSKEVVESYAPKGKNIFFYNTKKTKAKLLLEHPEVKDALIFKGIPNAVKVVVLEEDPKIVWQSGDKKYLVSSQGKAAKQIGADEFKDLPLIIDKQGVALEPGQNLVSANFIAFVMNINNQFFDKTNIKINHYEIGETTFDLNVMTEAGFFVKFNSMRSSARQLENLKIVLMSKRADIHEYVDLRIDGWGYYK